MASDQVKASCEASRGAQFSDRVASRICKEVAADDNPFLAERMLWHGYDVFELMRNRDFVEVIFLLLKGDLPSGDQKRLFESILVVLANPGPRHPAARAVMNAGVSKTNPVHFLPIALSMMGGEHLGSLEVVAAMKFMARNISKDPHDVAVNVLRGKETSEGSSAAGFGGRFGARDPFAKTLVTFLVDEHRICASLRWGQALIEALDDDSIGWLMTGVAAAVFLDLGFMPNVGGGIFQLASSPGLLAHGIEMSNKPITAMPFIANEDYHWVAADE